MEIDELTLTSIDAHRHLTTNWSIVEAVGFAARAGYNDVTAYRFVTALAMSDRLNRPADWGRVLVRVADLQRADIANDEAPDQSA